VDSSHRAPADVSIDRLAALRTASSGSDSSAPSAIQPKAVAVVGLVVLLAVAGFLVVKLSAPSGELQTAGGAASVGAPPTAQPELLAGEALMAFPVKQGNYPPALGPGDVVRVVVTPGADGSGEIKMVDELVVVSDVSEISDISSDVVVTVRGREEILKMLAGSGPIHVARVNRAGEVE
jgi:hypothetical protein